MRKFWRIAGGIGLVLAVVLGFGIYRTVWGKPFTITVLANRQALEFLGDNLPQHLVDPQ